MEQKTSACANKSVFVFVSTHDCQPQLQFGLLLRDNYVLFYGKRVKKKKEHLILCFHKTDAVFFFFHFSGQDDLFHRLITRSKRVSLRARQAA